jgi:hypothetical protein
MQKPFQILLIFAAGLLFTASLTAQTAVGSPQNSPAEPTSCDSLDPTQPHADVLRGVCNYAVTVPKRMPNFRCQQETARTLTTGENKFDIITGIVTYEDGQESYQDVKRNGQPVPGGIVPGGAWSAGQFGSHLQSLFDGRNKVEIHFIGESKVEGEKAWEFTYRVAHQDVALWRLHVMNQTLAPPYYGNFWIGQQDGHILRLLVEANQLPMSFPLANATLEIDYQNVLFADGSHFVLPVKSVLNSIPYEGPKARNVQEFKDCKKFTATHQIVVPAQ